MNKLPYIMIIVGALGMYAAVSGTAPVGPDIPIPPIPSPDNPFPSAPTNPKILSLAKQVTSVLKDSSHPTDVLVIASTFRDWGQFLVDDREIRNTMEFRDVWMTSTKVFFSHTDMVGRYVGLDSTIEQIIIQSLIGSDPNLRSGKETVPLNTTIREAYRSAMNAVSWGAYSAFTSN